MAAEARVGHIRVSDTASGNGVGHGRLATEVCTAV